MSKLRLAYSADDDWHGELHAAVESDGFVGRGSAWFGLEQLQNFNEELIACPISDNGPTIAGGLWEGGALDQTHLRVHLTPIGSRGLVRALVQLATPIWRPEDIELQQNLTVRFSVTYGDLARFHTSLSALLRNETREAILEAWPS